MKSFASHCAATAAMFLFSCSLLAAPITFNFTFTANAPSTANAVGSITFDDTLIGNPGNNTIPLPNPGVLALNVTVSGATSGNGSFTLADFDDVYFVLPSMLDFSQQLVGQPTSGSPWGTPGGCGGPVPGPGDAGDFNLISGGGPLPTGQPTPVGVDCFSLQADGGNADVMLLTSMIATNAAAAATPTPALSIWSLLLLAASLALAGAIGLNRFSRSRS